MNKEEYMKSKAALEEEFCNSKKELDKDFALSNNPVKIGDIITDHYKTIRVEKFIIGYSYSSNLPCMFYRGTRLNKKGEPAKREADDNRVSQNDIKTINGKPYKYDAK